MLMVSSSQFAINIRSLCEQSDLEAAVSLQRDIWSYKDIDIDSRAMLTGASRFAGQILGAFDRERLIGFALAYATLSFGRLHSHRVGILPEYQNFGIGRKLKLAQREDALARNIAVIQWTFDPLQSRNAYFNLVRLGGIAKTYIPNLYGITTSLLHGGLPTDRLLIEWELESERVRRILAGEAPDASNDVREILLSPHADRSNAAVQDRLREEFLAYLGDGFSVTGFREENGSHIYVLERL